MSEQKPTGDLDADILSDRDTWIAKDSFNTTIVAGKTDEGLSDALKNNRVVTSNLKEKYANQIDNDGGLDRAPSRDRRTIFKELDRIHTANEGIKNELRGRGIDFDLESSDEEHPNAAARRISNERSAAQARTKEKSDCWVVTAIYGWDSHELATARMVCRTRFALNPLVTPSWLLYKLLGPHLAWLSTRTPMARELIRLFVAQPIVNASGPSFVSAVAWQLYLAVPGWACIALLVRLLTQ